MIAVVNTRGRVFNGSKVFIGLRTDIFGVDREHITLEYIGAFPTWDELLEKCAFWESQLGDAVRVNVTGFANWKTNFFYKVALVEFEGKHDLSWSKNWHITLEQQAKPFDSMPIISEETLSDTCYDLWVGFADKDGNKHWVSHRRLSSQLIPALAIPSQ